MKTSKANTALLLVAALIVVSCAFVAAMPASARQDESCIDCHTNADLLKTPVPEKAEESGESGET